MTLKQALLTIKQVTVGYKHPVYIIGTFQLVLLMIINIIEWKKQSCACETRNSKQLQEEFLNYKVFKRCYIAILPEESLKRGLL